MREVPDGDRPTLLRSTDGRVEIVPTSKPTSLDGERPGPSRAGRGLLPHAVARLIVAFRTVAGWRSWP